MARYYEREGDAPGGPTPPVSSPATVCDASLERVLECFNKKLDTAGISRRRTTPTETEHRRDDHRNDQPPLTRPARLVSATADRISERRRGVQLARDYRDREHVTIAEMARRRGRA